MTTDPAIIICQANLRSRTGRLVLTRFCQWNSRFSMPLRCLDKNHKRISLISSPCISFLLIFSQLRSLLDPSIDITYCQQHRRQQISALNCRRVAEISKGRHGIALSISHPSQLIQGFLTALDYFRHSYISLEFSSQSLSAATKPMG